MEDELDRAADSSSQAEPSSFPTTAPAEATFVERLRRQIQPRLPNSLIDIKRA